MTNGITTFILVVWSHNFAPEQPLFEVFQNLKY